MKFMKLNIFLTISLFASVVISAGDIIIEKNGVQLSTGEVDSFLLTIPEKDRKLFSANTQRMIEVIDNLIVNKVSYESALEIGLDENPEVKAKIAQATQRIMVEAWIEQHIATQPGADYKAIAHENYILNKDQYNSPETVDVKHILIGTRSRSAEEAHQLADQVLQELKADQISFDAAAEEYTEDPTYKNNRGLIAGVRRGASVPEFEQAAFMLTAESPLSNVVDTKFGSHIIYLVAKNPSRSLSFAEVESQLIEEARQAQRTRIIDSYLDVIRKQEVTVNQEVLNAYLESYKPEQS